MKYTTIAVITFLLILFGINAKSQNTTNTIDSIFNLSLIEKIYTEKIEVDSMSEFPNGEEALFQFLSKNVKYPEAARKKEIQGNVYVTFVVEKNGDFSDVKVFKGTEKSLDEEAIRVINSFPRNWKPAYKM